MSLAGEGGKAGWGGGGSLPARDAGAAATETRRPEQLGRARKGVAEAGGGGGE